MRIYPRIVGEFDDSALMKVFGQAGTGVFIVSTPIATEVAEDYDVRIIGTTEDVREQYFAISAERRISHPAVSAIGVHPAQHRDQHREEQVGRAVIGLG